MTVWHDRVVAATAALFVAGSGRPRGTGVLIEANKVLTCRHVLTHADGTLAWEVTVRLPGLAPVTAHPEQDLPQIDAVVLTLAAAVPTRPVLLSGSGRPPAKAELLGYPQADRTDDGVWRSFTVAGPTASGQVQLDWDDDAGSFKGHSGGPVIDPDTGTLVGILRHGSVEGRFDRYLPLARMVEAGVLARMPWLVEGDEAAGHFTRRSQGRYGSGSPAGDLFTGRQAALARVQGWLTAAEGGGRVLVVTGQPGAGKSAVVARAGLAAAEALRDNGNWRGLLFHARAATAAQFRTHLADLFGSQADGSNHELLEDADRIAEDRPDRRWVVLVDALDEASTGTDRAQIAALLREFGRRPWVRAAVATRPLSATGPYAPGSLLRHFDVTSATDGHLVDLDSPDYFTPTDLERLAARLLRAEQQRFPVPGAAWQAYRADDGLTGRLAAAIARAAGRNFLVAGMTAPPLAEAAGTLDPAAPGFDPRSLPTSVGSALDSYLARQPDGARLRGVLVALAYAEGAGMDDDTWRLAADALGYPVTQADLDTLRSSTVADYLLQTTTERDGHLVRLFHQALVDRLLEGRDRRHDQHRIAGALITRTSWADASTYALTHLATHARRGRRLPELLTDHDYLLHADLPTLRAQLGATSAPGAAAHAALVLAAGDRVDDAPAPRRAAWLALHAAHLGLPELVRDFGRRGDAVLRPVWAHTLGSHRAALTGHTGAVHAVSAVPLADGRTLLATAGDDQTVRLWDPTTGSPVGQPLTGHTGRLRAAAAVPLPDGRTLLATGGDDQTLRLWDPGTGTPVGDPLTHYTGWIYAAAAVPLPDGRTLLATAGNEHETVRLWDPATGAGVGELLTRAGPINAVAAIPLPDGRTLLATAGEGGNVQLWDPTTGTPVGDPLTGHTGSMYAVAAVPLPDGRTLLATGGNDQAVRLWDPTTGAPVGHPLTGHTDAILAMSPVPWPDGRILLATAGDDATVRLWDPAAGVAVGPALALAERSEALAVVGGRLAVASGRALCMFEVNVDGG